MQGEAKSWVSDCYIDNLLVLGSYLKNIWSYYNISKKWRSDEFCFHQFNKFNFVELETEVVILKIIVMC